MPTLDIILGYLEARFGYGYWTELYDCIFEKEEEEEEEEEEYEGEKEEEKE